MVDLGEGSCDFRRFGILSGSCPGGSTSADSGRAYTEGVFNPKGGSSSEFPQQSMNQSISYSTYQGSNIHVHIRMHVCMYVCMHVCMHVCMCLCVYAELYIYVYMDVYMKC